jgi:hypothetical protein
MSRCKNNEFIQIKNTHRDAPRKTILTKILTFLEIATAQIADNMLNTPLVLLSYQNLLFFRQKLPGTLAGPLLLESIKLV